MRSVSSGSAVPAVVTAVATATAIADGRHRRSPNGCAVSTSPAIALIPPFPTRPAVRTIRIHRMIAGVAVIAVRVKLITRIPRILRDTDQWE